MEQFISRYEIKPTGAVVDGTKKTKDVFSHPANILQKDEFWLNILGISDSFRMIIRTGNNAGSKDMLTRREDTRHN
ncbi:hypothetical protein DTO021C3_7475 [Paecilomyces variotii]|nr:hypothetical protein DTO021C3_7475 [Paecilomyces variotii]